MRAPDPLELSALLDGELDARRAAEVEAAIAADPVLAAEYDSLRLADAHLRSIAGPAPFVPGIVWPAPAPGLRAAWLAAPALIIPIGWAAGKLSPAMTTAVAFNGLSLAVVVAGLWLLAAREIRTGAAPRAGVAPGHA